MPKREEIYIRQSTNLYDLLDDGIENGSDLPELAALKTNDEPRTADQTRGAADHPVRAPRAVRRTRRNWGGALLGATLAVAGTAAAIWPEEMMVWHHRTLYLPTFAEHVTRMEARAYGIAVAVSGLTVLALSLVRLPRTRGRT